MRDQRILITGVGGFGGRHLLARLRGEHPAAIIGLDTLPVEAVAPDDWTYLRCNLTDAAAVLQAVEQARPQIVFHLAGRFRASSAEQLRQVNVDGFRHLVTALRQAAERTRPIRMVSVGSAAEIGSAGIARLPVTEEVACQPDTDYGRSTFEATRLALAEPVDGPLEIIVARPFNLIGAGLDPALSLGSFAQQVAVAARGQLDSIRCGRLDTRRDYVDVHDAVEAMLALAFRGRPGQIYNVASGRSYAIGDLLERMIRLAGLSVPVVVDPARLRPDDIADIYGDPTKLSRETGWQPTVPIDQSLASLLGDAMNQSTETAAGGG
jgi:GDP-4-dehydro-6-deoxy-D-mannose reductase